MERLWEGPFLFPSPAHFYDCWPSTFGRRRSYNQSGYFYFHTGLDVCGQVGTEVYSPAAGEVVFMGEMIVRGNALMINHGLGIYSGYMHLSEILVNIGDQVEPGQLIARVGDTGRVTGPHLHWEIWAGGVQVDPMDWMNQEYP
jgi:murein DD-endopeptidase MepM/ murein hydrolase activator NlpD